MGIRSRSKKERRSRGIFGWVSKRSEESSRRAMWDVSWEAFLVHSYSVYFSFWLLPSFFYMFIQHWFKSGVYFSGWKLVLWDRARNLLDVSRDLSRPRVDTPSLPPCEKKISRLTWYGLTTASGVSRYQLWGEHVIATFGSLYLFLNWQCEYLIYLVVHWWHLWQDQWVACVRALLALVVCSWHLWKDHWLVNTFIITTTKI